ncbi:MAG: ANTAR domain-containing protein [Lachnospiraceae bacterium]|nr:ANTAR domain-containing protein [Lachnospiraceae bacterium]
MRRGSIIIALPKQEDAKRIKDILRQRGMGEALICTTATSVLTQVHQLDYGIVICSSKVEDMHYTWLAEYLPENFEMLLMASPAILATSSPGVMYLQLPLKTVDLVGTAEMMLYQIGRRMKKQRSGGIKRNEQEQRDIRQAKGLLMERNHMTEPEAFRYIQKCSMDSGTNMVETAQMILMMMQ